MPKKAESVYCLVSPGIVCYAKKRNNFFGLVLWAKWFNSTRAVQLSFFRVRSVIGRLFKTSVGYRSVSCFKKGKQNSNFKFIFQLFT